MVCAQRASAAVLVDPVRVRVLCRAVRYAHQWPHALLREDRAWGQFPETPFDRQRVGGHPPTPATPPYVRVRIRRFESVTLTFLEPA